MVACCVFMEDNKRDVSTVMGNIGGRAKQSKQCGDPV